MAHLRGESPAQLVDYAIVKHLPPFQLTLMLIMDDIMGLEQKLVLRETNLETKMLLLRDYNDVIKL